MAQARWQTEAVETPITEMIHGKVVGQELLPCMDVGISLLENMYETGGALPGFEVCDGPIISFSWTSTATQGEGDLRIDFAPRDEDEMGILSDDVVPVGKGPLHRIGDLLGLTWDEAEEDHRVVLHVRFSAAWMGAGCGDVRGEATATVNGARVQAQPAAPFFRSLCALSHADSPAALLSPGLILAIAADGIDAVARESSEGWAPRALALRDALSRMASAAPALPGPPEIGAPDEPTSGAAGDLRVEAAPEAREVWVREDVAVAAVIVEARHQWAAAVDADAHASPRAPATAPAWRASAPAPERHGGAFVGEALPAPGRGLGASPSAASPLRSPSTPEVVPLVTLSSGGASARAAPALSAIAAAALAAGVLLLVGLALYQRIARHEALDHPARQALHAACVARGAAAAASDLAAAVGIGRKTAEHHLRYLVRLGLLREERAPDAPRRYALPASALAQPQEGIDERLLACVLERPGVSTVEAAKALSLAPLRADRRLKALVMDGLLESRVAGRARRFFPAQDAQRAAFRLPQ